MVDERPFSMSDWQLDDCLRLLKLRGVLDDRLPEQLAAIAALATQRAHSRPEELSQRAWLLGIACEVSRHDFAGLRAEVRLTAAGPCDASKSQVHSALATVTGFFERPNRRS